MYTIAAQRLQTADVRLAQLPNDAFAGKGKCACQWVPNRLGHYEGEINGLLAT